MCGTVSSPSDEQEVLVTVMSREVLITVMSREVSSHRDEQEGLISS